MSRFHCWAASVRSARSNLQHGVPLADLVRRSLDLHFLPSGHTDDPQVPRTRSIADYLARRLAIDWLPLAERARLGIFTTSERMDHARAWLARADAELPTMPTPDHGLSTWRWSLATGLHSPQHILTRTSASYPHLIHAFLTS